MALPKYLKPLQSFMSTRRGRHLDAQLVKYGGRSLLGYLIGRDLGTRGRGATPPPDGARRGGPMALTTIGHRTGKLHTIAISFRHLPDGTIAIVGSAGASPTEPHWVRNLRANPAAWVHINRKETPVRGTVLEGDAKYPLWDEITAVAPIFAEYQRRTERDIPVVVLRSYDGSPIE